METPSYDQGYTAYAHLLDVNKRKLLVLTLTSKMITLSLSAALLAGGVCTATIGQHIADGGLLKTTHVSADTKSDEKADKYDTAVKELHQAYLTRSEKDMDKAKEAIDDMDSKSDETRMTKSLDNLKVFKEDVAKVDESVKVAEKSTSKVDFEKAKSVVSNMNNDIYLYNDKANFSKRLSTVDSKIKAEDAKKAEEARKAEAAKQAQEAAQAAAAQAAAEAEKAAAQAAQEAKEAEAKKAQEATQASSTATSASTSGIDLNQTSGTIDINAVANYMAARGTAAGYSASEWAYIITHESNGSLTATNASSGAYGFAQLLGHGEYAGMTLGEQIDMASKLPAGSWVVYN